MDCKIATQMIKECHDGLESRIRHAVTVWQAATLAFSNQRVA